MELRNGKSSITSLASSNQRFEKKSTLGIKYPTFRDNPLHTAYMWLKGKEIDDNAEGLWRVHDKLYDLTSFIPYHPGGASWLEMTKGVDITEAFETHHINILAAETLLSKFFVREAASPRNYPFTFEDNGFYRVLKTRVRDALPHLPTSPRNRSKLLADLLLIAYVVGAILCVYYKSFAVGVLAGVSLSLLATGAHNFFHQRDNFRMYYFDLSLLSSREWRVSHVLSHHLYTNTIQDLEISALEPWLQYLPQKKPIIFRYFWVVYFPILYMLLFIVSYIKTMLQDCINQRLSFTVLLPLLVPTLTFFLNPNYMSVVFSLWIFVTASIHFSFVGLNAGHHHPLSFHDGDNPIRPVNELDWGVYQLSAVFDRVEITGSHFLVLTHFGDHALHHLFPTIDHGQLHYLYPILEKTCAEFGIQLRFITQLDAIKGQFQQLFRVKGR